MHQEEGNYRDTELGIQVKHKEDTKSPIFLISLIIAPFELVVFFHLVHNLCAWSFQ